jgi:hypoxanthine phosphoribosyltransferase
MYFGKPPDPMRLSRSARMPRKLVHTLDEVSFAVACTNLMHRVLADYDPDLLVGIRTGGLVVAETMAQTLAGSFAVLPLTCRRPATGIKAQLKCLPRLLKVVPQPAVDCLRWAENHIFSVWRRRGTRTQQIDHGEAGDIGRHISHSSDPLRLLVVDDAVDSGITLVTVLNLLHQVCPPKTELRSAAITVTSARPLVEPDFLLYRGVLCRFPWSLDASR